MKTPLVKDYLEQFPDPKSRARYPNAYILYTKLIELCGQRRGQAFMNALPEKQYEMLARTAFDPFYSDYSKAVDGAIEFLMDKGL